jgi:hypothetical protein
MLGSLRFILGAPRCRIDVAPCASSVFSERVVNSGKGVGQWVGPEWHEDKGELGQLCHEMARGLSPGFQPGFNPGNSAIKRRPEGTQDREHLGAVPPLSSLGISIAFLSQAPSGLTVYHIISQG